MKKLIIIGAGGHACVVADIVEKLAKYDKIEFLDDFLSGERMGYPIVGKIADYKKYKNTADFFVAIGNTKIREELVTQLLNEKISMPPLIHPNAVIARGVSIGAGSVVMAGSVINSCTQIGKGVIINTCSSIDHECIINDFCHISVGAHLAGSVTIGARTWIGIGACVSNNLSICNDCMIGAGAVVVKNIIIPDTYIGVPAKRREAK